MQPRDLSNHAVYVPGEGIEEVARELGRESDELVALSSNENPFGASPAAIEAVREGAEDINEYPKANHTDLTNRLAERWELAPEQIWLSAGADGAIDYLTRTTLRPGESILVPDPGFAYYPMSARYHHGDSSSYPVEKEREFAITAEVVLDAYDDERIVYLTSPHNPTGSTVPLDDVREIADGTDEDTLVVVDEAYGEFADRPSARELLDERDDVAVLRTFSKAHGLAGLRLGYAMVPDTWADAYGRVNTPFAVNEMACRAGLAALDDDEHVERTVGAARRARARMHEEIDAPSWEGEGNFVLIDVGDANAVAEALKRDGVIVRDCTSFGLPGCVRISCGTAEETDRAIEAINAVLAEGQARADGGTVGASGGN